MLEGLQKFGRALKRDYLPATPRDSKTFTFAKEYAMSLGIVWGICLAVCCFMPLATAGGILLFAAEVTPAIFFLRLREIRKEMEKKTAGQIAADNGETLSLSGPGRKVCLIENTQKIVSKLTASCENKDELPPHIRAKLEPYIGDSAEAAAAVNASLKSQPQERIPFLRRVFNSAGDAGAAIAASVLTPFGLERKKAADYDAAVAASIGHCQDGLPQDIRVKPLRLKLGLTA